MVQVWESNIPPGPLSGGSHIYLRMLALELAMGFLLSLSFFQRHLSWVSVNALTSWALLASTALSRLFIVSKSWRSHTPGTPASEATSPRLLNSLAGTQPTYEGSPRATRRHSAKQNWLIPAHSTSRGPHGLRA